MAIRAACAAVDRLARARARTGGDDPGWRPDERWVLRPGPGVRRRVVRPTHAVGGLWIADEVQGGHGRTGDAMWSFQRFGIMPDFVTLGKPMGNGHPVAAVITRREIAARFADETVFFSTFGGNPVSAAAGLAVLDVLEDEHVLPTGPDRRRSPPRRDPRGRSRATTPSAMSEAWAWRSASRSSAPRSKAPIPTPPADQGRHAGTRRARGDDRHGGQHPEGPPSARLHRGRGPGLPRRARGGRSRSSTPSPSGAQRVDRMRFWTTPRTLRAAAWSRVTNASPCNWE